MPLPCCLDEPYALKPGNSSSPPPPPPSTIYWTNQTKALQLTILMPGWRQVAVKCSTTAENMYKCIEARIKCIYTAVKLFQAECATCLDKNTVARSNLPGTKKIQKVYHLC